MRILHIEFGFDFPPPGGEQKRVFEECRRLSQTEEVLLVYDSLSRDRENTKKEFDQGRIPFKTIGVNINQKIFRPGRWNFVRNLLFPIRRKEAGPIKEIIRNFNPDIVHIHSSGGGIALSYAIYAAKTLNIPTVMMMHNHWPFCAAIGYFDFKQKKYCGIDEVCGKCISDRYKPVVSFLYRNRLVKYVLKNIDHFIGYTDFTKFLLIKAGVSSRNVTIIPPGVERGIKRTVQGFEQRKYIAFSGRISIEKGPDIFLEVAKYYTYRDDLYFLVIGDGLLKNEMEKLAKKYQVKNITFTGWIDDRESYFDLLCQTKVLIVPSLWVETFGIVILDAYQCGVPVIASNRGGIPYFVKDRENGFVVEPNAQQIISKLDTIINDSSLWQQMSNSCLSFDFKKFNWDSSTEQLRALYHKIIPSH